MCETPDFSKFAEQFYSHVLDDVESKDELIELALTPFTDIKHRVRLRAYLDEITSDRNSGDDLKRIWWSSPADTVFHDGEELRTFLRMVRDRR